MPPSQTDTPKRHPSFPLDDPSFPLDDPTFPLDDPTFPLDDLTSAPQGPISHLNKLFHSTKQLSHLTNGGGPQPQARGRRNSVEWDFGLLSSGPCRRVGNLCRSVPASFKLDPLPPLPPLRQTMTPDMTFRSTPAEQQAAQGREGTLIFRLPSSALSVPVLPR